MNKLVIPPGHEIRCELIRLYPGQEDHRIIQKLQREIRDATNHIIRGRDDVKSARRIYALRSGIGGPPPVMPERPNLPKPQSEEEKKVVREAWREYDKRVEATYPTWTKWYKEVDAATKDIPELSWRSDKYQDVRKIYVREGNAVLYRDTVKRVNQTKRAQYKRVCDWVPLMWGNAPAVQTGGFYGTRRGNPFYNALVCVNGMKIPGRLRRPLPGTPIQGVTITREADGLYAAIKCIVPIRTLKEPVLPAVGVDVGQTDLVALSDGYTERNIRTSALVAQIAAIQEKGDRSDDTNTQKECRNKAARLHQSYYRRISHWLNTDLLPRLERHSAVFVEALAKGFKSNKGPLSCMHRILNAIKLRLGDRVREVRCAGTSQECSHCGNHAPEARKGKVYACTNQHCTAVLDADINASRNILRRGLESLAAVG